MAKHEYAPWEGRCRCGGKAVREARFDDMLDEMYHRYRCDRCGAKTLPHLTRWEAQTEWEEKYAAACD